MAYNPGEDTTFLVRRKFRPMLEKIAAHEDRQPARQLERLIKAAYDKLPADAK